MDERIMLNDAVEYTLKLAMLKQAQNQIILLKNHGRLMPLYLKSIVMRSSCFSLNLNIALLHGAAYLGMQLFGPKN